MPVCLLRGVCYRLRHRGGVSGSVCDLGQGCAAAAVNLYRRACYNVLWYGDVSVGFAAFQTLGECVKVGEWHPHSKAFVYGACSFLARRCCRACAEVFGLC